MEAKVPGKATLQSPLVMILLSVGLAVLYWVMEALMDAFVFGEGGFVERLITPDRNELWMRMIISGLLVGFGVYGTAVIRRRRRAQEALEESREWLSTTLRSIGDGVITTDARCFVTFMNPVAEALTGWAEDDANGKPLEDVFNIINEQTGEKAETPVERILREGVVVGLANHTALVARDGTTRPIVDSGAPITTDQGIIGTVLVFRDATEQREAGAAMRASEERFRDLYEQAPLAYFTVDMDGLIQMANRRATEMLGYGQGDLTGRPVFDLYADTPSGKQRAQELFLEFQGGQQIQGEELEMSKGDGGSVWVSLTVNPVMDTDGNVIQSRSMAEDITERKQAQDALKSSQQWLSTTLRSIGDAVITTDASGFVTFMNPVAEGLTGWAEDDANGKPLEDVFNIINEQTGEKAETPVERILREGVVVGLANHTALVAKDGTIRPIVDSGAPITTDQGIIGTVLVFSDATEAREAEAALTGRTRELEALVEIANLIAKSGSFEERAERVLAAVTRVMDTDRATFRVPSQEGQELQLLAWVGSTVIAVPSLTADRRDLGTPWLAFDGGEVIVENDYASRSGARPEMVADGIRSVVSLPVTVGSTVTGVITAQSRSVGHFTADRVRLLTAVTNGMGVLLESARAEAVLRESEERYRAIFESSPFGIGLGDLDQRILDVNEAFCQMLGYSKEELIGSRISDITHPDDIERGLEPIRQVLRGEIPRYQVEKRYIAKGNRVVWARVSGSAVRGHDGRPMYALSVMEDIGERMRMESELQTRTQQLESLAQQQVNRMEADRRDIALELHDEVGQQLTVLGLVLGRGGAGSSTVATVSLLEASTIVDNLMAKVRDLANRLRPGMLDDLGLLPAVIWLLDDFLTHSGLRVEFRHNGIDRRFPPGVETAVYRIVQEALTNVVRHSGVDEATVLLWADDEALGLRVEDKGSGFDLDSFEFSLQSIGLSGIRERVAAVNGQFRIESTPGTGTRLIVELPFRDA